MHLGQPILIQCRTHTADPVTLQNHVIVDIDQRALKFEGLVGRAWRTWLCFQVEFQRSNALQNTNCLCRVLHTGQFNDDSIRALLLHGWFGHTQGIYPIE